MRRPTLLALSVVLVLGVVTPASGDAVGLDDPQHVDADVESAVVTPDGETVLYVADDETPGAFELYAVPADGSAPPMRLSQIADADRGVSSVRVSPDGQRAVYRGDLTTDGIEELWSVRVDGTGSPVKLNGAPVTGSVANSYAISPDSTRVVYENQELSTDRELFSVPIVGGGSTRLNTAITGAAFIAISFRITPNGQRVVYRMEQDSTDAEVYSVPITGGTPTALSPHTGGYEAGTDIEITPGSDRVVYRYGTSPNLFDTRVQSVPITGGTVTNLSPALAASRRILSFELSPDGGRVVYRGDQQTDDVDELYSVPVTGPSSSVVKLNPPLGGVESSFDISPDSTLVAFRGVTDGRHGLFTVPIAGPSSSAVNRTPDVPLGGIITSSHAFTPDSRTIVLRGLVATIEQVELFAVDATGPVGTPTRLNQDLATDRNVTSHALTVDGSRVVFVADPDATDEDQGYSVPVDGSDDPVRFSADLGPGGGNDLFLTFPPAVPDGHRVVYRHNVTGAEAGMRLFSSVLPPLAAESVAAVAGDATVEVTWDAPSSGAVPSSYVVTLAPGGASETVTGTSAIFEGLTNGTSYTATVVARNEGGDGPAASAAPVVPSATAAGVEGAVRLSGAGREETAVEISRASYPADGSAAAVVLARRDDFADGLAGTPLAASVDGPLLLTPTSRLDEATAAEIERVLPAGGTVHLLGGEAALSGAVVDALEDLGYATERVFGANRYETAVAIAGELGDVSTVFVTRGDAFPDALAAGPAAIEANGAIVLSAERNPASATTAYLDALPSSVDVVAVGGQAAEAYPTADPVVGAGREQTAILVADAFFEDPTVVGIARRDDFADALTGGAHIGGLGGPVLLTSSSALNDDVADWLEAATPTLTTAYVYGGTAAVADAVLDAVDAIVG